MDMIPWEETLPQRVRQWSMIQPQKPAICIGEKMFTYADLENMVNSYCRFFTNTGLIRGKCIVLSAVMKAEYVAAFLAVKRQRMIAVPVNRTASEFEVADIVERTQAELLLTDNPKYQNIRGYTSLRESGVFADEPKVIFESEKEFIPGEEITEILFTSGTTGRPKGVMLSQGGLCASIRNTATGMGMQRDDVLLLPLPLNHSFGLRVLRAALYNGETVVLQNGFSFAKEVQHNIERWHCNCMAAVISGFEMLQQQMGASYKNVFGQLKYIEFSAGPVTAVKRKQLMADLPNTKLYNTWGSTETGGGLFLEFSAESGKLDSAGKAINDIQAAIVDINGNAAPVGEFGRLALSGSALMVGYYAEPELTKTAIHGEWLWTNDLAKMDEDGYVYLNGRVDDMINVGGEKVAPADVERIVSLQPGVKECACCGVEDPGGILGQVPVIFIVADTTQYDEKQIEREIRRQGNGSMVPAAYIKLPELPHNYMGKLDRKRLREIWKEFKNSARSEEECSKNSDDFAEKILNLITGRRSVRSFKEKPVARQHIEKLLLAGRMAPSGHNMQTWRFTVLQNQSNIQVLKETIRHVAEEKKTLFYGFQNPQVLIIVSNDSRNADGIQDSSAAIENILLMAHALGLGACWLNALIKISNEPEIRTLLDSYDIPSTHIVHGIIGLGYPEVIPKPPVKKENVVRFID